LWVAAYLADLLGRVLAVVCVFVLHARIIGLENGRVPRVASHSLSLSSRPIFSPILRFSSAIVPCTCRRLGQCGWRRPSCGRWRPWRRLGHIRCAGPVASVWAAWEGRHRRRQGASQAWPASRRNDRQQRRNEFQVGSQAGRQAKHRSELLAGNFRLTCASCEGGRAQGIRSRWHEWWVRRGGGDSRLSGLEHSRGSSDESSLTPIYKFPAPNLSPSPTTRAPVTSRPIFINWRSHIGSLIGRASVSHG
jgi:hypothetical protein